MLICLELKLFWLIIYHEQQQITSMAKFSCISVLNISQDLTYVLRLRLNFLFLFFFENVLLFIAKGSQIHCIDAIGIIDNVHFPPHDSPEEIKQNQLLRLTIRHRDSLSISDLFGRIAYNVRYALWIRTKNPLSNKSCYVVEHHVLISHFLLKDY